MKIQAAKIDGFIKSPDKSCLAVLLYGPDIGLAAQRAEKLGKLIVSDLSDPFSVIEINPSTIKEDGAIFGDEMSAMNFAGGKRLIRIRDANNAIAKNIGEYFDNLNSEIDSFAILTAGDLPPSSALRKLFERHRGLAALPCYHDDARSLSGVVREELTKRGFHFNSEIAAFISQNCLGDRMITASEIEKLDLYKGAERNLTLNDVIISIGETTQSSFDDICNYVANGDINLLEKHLSKAFEQGAAPVAILRALGRYFTRLHMVAGRLIKGESKEMAIKSLRPPVFFKQLPSFNMHVTKWGRGNLLWRAFEIIYNAELDCKKSGANPELICSRNLMKITSFVRARP